MFFLCAVASVDVSAQVDKREVRRGNRDFKKENYKEAELEYFRALAKDTLSFAANYNMANTLYIYLVKKSKNWLNINLWSNK